MILSAPQPPRAPVIYTLTMTWLFNVHIVRRMAHPSALGLAVLASYGA